MKNLSLKIKLIAVLLLIGITSIFTIGLQGYRSGKQAVSDQAFNQLTAIRATKGSAIESYFIQIRNQIETFSEDRMIVDAMREFKIAYHSLSDELKPTPEQLVEYEKVVKDYYENEYLATLHKNTDNKQDINAYWPGEDNTTVAQYLYLAHNSNATGEKDNLNNAGDGSTYSKLHEKYHPVIRNYLKKFGYYDIFLVDPNTGHIVYTVFKEVDYTTSLLTGPYKDTNFARAFRQANDATEATFIKLEDFEPYDPSYAAPASFIASPIFDGNEKIGVLLFQMPIDDINNVMTGNQNWKNDGLGDSGETYIVGGDFRMRSVSRFLVEDPQGYFNALRDAGFESSVIDRIKQLETSILFQEVKTDASTEALNGKIGREIVNDYRNIPVLSSYSPLKIEGVNWAILSEIDEAEAFAPVQELSKKIAIWGGIILIFVVVVALVFTKTITTPIFKLMRVAEGVAKGNLNQQVAIDSRDEIGRMGTAFNKAIEAIRKANTESEAANTNAKDLAAKANSAVDGSTSAMLQTDKELVVTYINPAAKSLFQKYSSEFSQIYSDFEVDSLCGLTVDTFLENGAEHKKIFLNASKLPYNTDMRLGNFIFEINASPMIDANGNHIGLSIEFKNVTAEREGAEKAAMLLSLVEAEEANVVTADKNSIITYLNPALKSLLKSYETEFRKQFPNFDSNQLIGEPLDSIHKDSNHPDGIINNIKTFPFKTDINVAGLEFGLNAMALLDNEGNHIGCAVEWIDNNARVRYRDEVQKLINNCQEGNLQNRGDVEKMDEVYRPMLRGINDIIEAITEPIKEIQEQLEGVAKGNLTSYVTGDYKGDHEALKKSLNNTLDSLNTILRQVNSSAGQMASGATQVSDSSQAISQGATEQAASLEEITSSMTEMGSQVKQNAENANQANQLVGAARGSAENGNNRMKDMVSAMTEIEESSQNIQKIIKVIDEIAFQTNLLALNAAVEAARAGVHGKGFAVVAEEVRNLAARSANAAKETTELIEGSIKKVTNGTELANSTATALGEIVDGVSKVTDLVGEIAAASNEQAQGISQVNEGLIQLDKVTQQNTASAEESASASVELSGQASQLQELLKQFTLSQKSSTIIEGGHPELTAEMLEAIKQFTTSQKIRNNEEDIPLLAASSSHVNDPIASVNPNDVIPMDDADMGRY